MSRAKAHATLERARCGEHVSLKEIIDALVDTGDLDPSDAIVQAWREAGTWERGYVGTLAKATWLDPIH